MNDTLKRLGIIRKRTLRALKPERNVIISVFVDPIFLDQRLYLDETGVCLNLTLPCDRSPQGERMFDQQPVSPGETVNSVAVLTEQGLAGQWCYQGFPTAQRFALIWKSIRCCLC